MSLAILSKENITKITLKLCGFHSNQEYLETLKQNIAEKQTKENEHLQASTRSMSVLNSIKLTIIDLIHKLEEVYVTTTGSVELGANENTPTNALLQVINIIICNNIFA